MDLATQSLNQHSTYPALDSYVLLRTHLLFSCNQPAEAVSQTLEWLRATSDLSTTTASTAVDLLMMHGAHTASLTAVSLLTDRLSSDVDEGCAGSDASKLYSDLQETKHRLLTEHIPVGTRSRPPPPLRVSYQDSAPDPRSDCPCSVVRTSSPGLDGGGRAPRDHPRWPLQRPTAARGGHARHARLEAVDIWRRALSLGRPLPDNRCGGPAPSQLCHGVGGGSALS